MANDSGNELSTLIALARVQKRGLDSSLDRERVISSLSSPWAQNLAKAILTDNEETLSSEDQRRDLYCVRELAGVGR